MSARQIRRLLEAQQLSSLNKSESESSEEEIEETSHKSNAFAGFMDSSSDESESEDEPVVEIVQEIPKEVSKKIVSKNNNKKNKNNKKQNNVKSNKISSKKESVNDILNTFPSNELIHNENHQSEDLNTEMNTIHLGTLLCINKKYMNDIKELKAKFGDVAVTQIVEENQRLRRYAQLNRNMTRHHSYYLVTPSVNNITPPSFINGGLELETIRNIYPYQTMFFPRDYDNDAIYYHLHYSTEYQRINDLYNAISISMDYNDIIQFFSSNPCHIESALAACELFLTTGQVDEATKILRQAIFIFENSWPFSFDIEKGTIRLLNNQNENRSIYRSLFLYMFLSSRKGCYSTALEICKLLLSFDPQLDHQGASLLMDYYAVCANKTSLIVSLCKSQPSIYLGHIPLLHLPNWSYSYALSLFREGEIDAARTQLLEAFLYFPQVYLKMKEKLKTINDKLLPADILDNLPFCIPCTNDHIEKLISIYVNRNYILWQDNKFLEFLTTTAYSLISSYDYKLYDTHQEDLEREFNCQLEANKELSKQGFTHFFDCNPSYFTDDLPHINLNEILNENINNRLHVPTNLPLDHNALQLFIESMLPWINANEENDIDNNYEDEN